MTLAEALTELKRAGPKGDEGWGAFRRARAEAAACLQQATVDELRPLHDALEASLDGSHDLEEIEALLGPLAKLALATGTLERWTKRASVATFKLTWMVALTRVSEPWPLIDDLAERLSDEDLRDFVNGLAPLLDRANERAVMLAAKRPALGMALVERRRWSNTSVEPFLDIMVGWLDSPDEKLQIKAATLLNSVDGALHAAMESLEQRLSIGPDEGPLVEALAELVVGRHLKARRRAACDRWLEDPRAAVRRGAFTAFVSRRTVPPSGVPRLLTALRDTDERIRGDAHRALLQQSAEGVELTAADVEGLLSLLPRDDVTGLLATLATAQPTVRQALAARLDTSTSLGKTVHARHSRACARCRWVGAEVVWGKSAPGSLKKSLELQPCGLWRCPTCSAHFSMRSETEYDVNSEHTSTWLRRLTLAELKRDYAAHLDFTADVFVHWRSALESDAHHVDPEIRARAVAELEALDRAVEPAPK